MLMAKDYSGFDLEKAIEVAEAIQIRVQELETLQETQGNFARIVELCGQVTAYAEVASVLIALAVVKIADLEESIRSVHEAADWPSAN